MINCEKYTCSSIVDATRTFEETQSRKHTKFDVENSENYLSNNNMLIGIPRNSLELLFQDWDKRINCVISC